MEEQTEKYLYLNKASVFKDLVRVANEFELLDYSHRLVQVQDDTCGCDTETGLQREITFTAEEISPCCCTKEC